MKGQPELYEILERLEIRYDYLEHPPVPTIEDAVKHWIDPTVAHCKNIFFRNHKGDRHYLVIVDYRHNLNIDALVKRLKQGKLSFASPHRLRKYLGVEGGSVSPFGLINDINSHTVIFIDKNLEQCDKISFHPNLNTASIVLYMQDFLKFMVWSGNSFEFIKLY